jgi:CheY-like chemotaxis protein
VSENPAHPPRTILIVEDNDLFRGMIRSLMTMRGYNVIVARNGPEGLALAAEHAIDGALTDIEMPEMNGYEFCRTLREQQQAAGRDVPVWIMSGVFRPALEKRAAEAGAILVLRKPFPIDEVCAQLEAEFQKREGGTDAS